MDIDKLNIQVKSGERAKSSDFNKTTAKVDEIIEALNGGGMGGGTVKVVTVSEYVDLRDRGELKHEFYAVMKKNELYRMYFYTTLFAKKGEDGEMISSFPFVFPIVFS